MKIAKKKNTLKILTTNIKFEISNNFQWLTSIFFIAPKLGVGSNEVENLSNYFKLCFLVLGVREGVLENSLLQREILFFAD